MIPPLLKGQYSDQFIIFVATTSALSLGYLYSRMEAHLGDAAFRFGIDCMHAPHSGVPSILISSEVIGLASGLA
jgi:hypothetical protein